MRATTEAQDLAWLSLETSLDHPCVWLGEGEAPFQELYSFGYPQHLASGGTSVCFTCEGWTERDEQTLLTLAGGQVVPGMSGAPVFSRQSGLVCGLLALTRDASSDLGRRAILARTVFQFAPSLQEAQAPLQQFDQRWQTLLETQRRLQGTKPATGAGMSPQGGRPILIPR